MSSTSAALRRRKAVSPVLRFATSVLL